MTLLMTREKSIKEAFGLETNYSRFSPADDLVPWLKVNYKIDELINDFWGLQTKSKLIAVTKDLDDSKWRGLVSEWDSFTDQAGQFRLNKSFIQNVLDLSLGERSMPMELKNLTDLEISICENFFVELENFWKDYWRVAKPNSYGTLNFLIWAIELDNQKLGSLAIGVPPGLIPKVAEAQKPCINIKELAKELNVEIPVDLLAGKTCLSIQDITNIEEGDLIIFEESDTNHLLWEKDKLHKLEVTLGLPDRQDPKYEDLYYDEADYE